MKHAMIVAAGTMLGLAALPAAAQVSWYAAASGGQARTNIEYVRSVEGGFNPQPVMQTSHDLRDAGWKLSGGLRLSPNVVLEVTYADLGKITTHTDGQGGTFIQPFGLDISRKVHGVGVDAVGNLPVASRFDVFGKLGIYRATVRTDISLVDAVVFSTAPDLRQRAVTGHEDIVHVGLGVQARITPRWAVRAEVERFMDVGNGFRSGDPNGTGRADVDLASLGVVFNF